MTQRRIATPRLAASVTLLGLAASICGLACSGAHPGATGAMADVESHGAPRVVDGSSVPPDRERGCHDTTPANRSQSPPAHEDCSCDVEPALTSHDSIDASPISLVALTNVASSDRDPGLGSSRRGLARPGADPPFAAGVLARTSILIL